MLVVGDAATLKVHVHTDEPEVAVAVFEDAGDVQRLDVADMREQIAEREARLAPARTGVVAVVAGEGIRALFEGLGAHVVDGGATLNPSTYEILAGIHEVPADEVLVLPELAERDPGCRGGGEAVREARSRRSLPLAAGGAGGARRARSELDAAANAERLDSALAGIRWGAVAPAAARTPRDGSCAATRSGSPATRSSPGEALARRCRRRSRGSPRGRDRHRDRGRRRPDPARPTCRSSSPRGSSWSSTEGGQPHYWWLIAAQ